MTASGASASAKRADVLVLGGGPAGLTAGLYAARAGKKTLILEGGAGSRLSIGYEVENYPGFVSIDSRELLNRFREHAAHFGAEFLKGEAIDFNLSGQVKYVATKDSFIEAGAVIIAFGKPLPKERMIPGEERLLGMGVSYCATCDGPLYRGQPVAAVGNSAEAGEEVLQLAGMGCRIHWIQGDGGECRVPAPVLEEFKAKGIRISLKTKIKEIAGEKRVEKVILIDGDIQEAVDVKGCFIFREIPAGLLFAKAGLNLDPKQCLVVDRFQRTNLEGVFAAGDVTCGGLQVVSAAGEGCVAAVQALHYLRQKE